MKKQVTILLMLVFTSLVFAQEDGHIYNISSSVEKLIDKSNKAYNKESLDKAVQYLEEARDKAPQNVQVLDKLAGLYYDVNRKLDAKKVYTEIETRITETLNGENDLTNAIKDELQLILDRASKRVREVEEDFSDEQMSFGATGKKLYATSETKIRFDQIDPDLEKKFLTKPKPLDEKASFDQQVKKVKGEVMEQFGKINDKDAWWDNDFGQILEINNDWLKHSAFSKLEWFSGLKVKEKEYLESIEHYEELLQEKDRLLNNRTIILGEISNIDMKTRWENEKRLDLQTKLQTQLKDELKGKLSAIPKSIVLVGRTKLSDTQQGLTLQEARTQRNQKLMEAMQKEAIRLVGGQKIDMYSSMQDNELKQFFSTSSQGTAQTIDNYYKDLNIEFRDQGKFTYLISRIEVFPLDDASMSTNYTSNQGSSNQAFTGGDINTTVYRWIDQDSILENCDNSRDRKPFYDHKFKTQERNYLDFQTKFSESLNERYKSEIEKAGNEYDRAVAETQLQINQSLENILSFNQRSTHLQDSLQVVETRLGAMDEEIIQSKLTAQRLAGEYQTYYKSNSSQINKLVIQSSKESQYSDKVTFESMVDKTLSGLEDIRKKSQSLVVYKEVSNEGESIKASEHTVEFEPVLRRFRILSMNKFEDDERDIFYSLNIAYDVGWNPVGETTEPNKATSSYTPAPSGVAASAPVSVSRPATTTGSYSSGTSTASSTSYSSNTSSTPTVGQTVGLTVGTKFNGDGSVTIELEGRRMDIMVVSQASSKVSYLYSDLSNTWRLPSHDELVKIFNLASINKGTSDDFIDKKFNWRGTWAAFLTSETNTNYQNETTNTCVELSRMDYSTRKDELLDDEAVYLLLIKK